jgi:Tfp pilus assembly protein PilO
MMPLTYRTAWAWGGLLVLLAANLWVLVFLLQPTRQARLDIETRIAGLERNVRSAQREGQSSETLLTAMREVEDFSQGFPRRAELVALMGRLTKLARSHALQVPDVDYRPTQAKEAGLTKVTVQLGVEGPYETIRRYLYELEGMRRFLVIERLTLRELKGTANLQVQLQLAMYLQ